ncbi:LamG-like jellyroll fold domain-containing protein [Megalodesulfovibrio gigas]|uniref:LamG-like jellyroll fold domain-containing protein n=1 Tax=Megalodesulfovibrio gigas (strain ATCC 19364 / DSM 1382 / NCIMB 9332 / VKM B-1759) TaxID=1121448 RepID=T2GEZ8_MEGG1|nr:LamG-like jellyroll fold domain-containing protein [Megalodesulfovibrio gigas]AGW14502.1 hypothetical protein DGI_2772 [Megalodesulfovibrio gigas DSM 1382 = ATCC 19364]
MRRSIIPFGMHLVRCIAMLGVLLCCTTAEARNPDVSSWMVNLSSGSSSTDTNNRNGAPEIAVVGDTVHAVWVTYQSDPYIGQIWYRRSLDGGATWQARIKIVEAPANELDITEYVKRLHVVGTSVHIAYIGHSSGGTWAGTVYYRRSTDNGASFGSAQSLFSATYLSLSHSYINGNGSKVTIAFRLSSSSGYKRDSGEVLRSTDNGATFTQTQCFLYDHNDPAYAGAAVYDLQHVGDNVYVMYGTSNGRGCSYEGESKMYLASSTNNGATFASQLLSIPQSNGCYKAYGGQDGHYASKIAALNNTVSATWAGTNTNSERCVFLRKSTNNGASFLDPLTLYNQTGNSTIQAGQETIRGKGNYLYAMWNTSDAKSMFRTSSNQGTSFGATTEATAGGWWPIVAVDGNSSDGSKAQLFWQGTLRTASNGGANLSGTSLLFPFWRTGWVQRAQIASTTDEALHYVMSAKFYSSSLCGGNCNEDIFYRRHALTPPNPTGRTCLRLRSETVSFESRYDNMHVPDSADVNMPGAFSIGLWVKPAAGGADTGYTNQYRPVVSKPQGIGYSYALGTILSLANPQGQDHTITAEITTAAGTFVVNPGGSNQGYVPTDQWSHLAMTYNPTGGANNFRLYLNGNQIAATTATGTVIADGNPMQAGRYGNWDIDDLHLWNKALTREELLADMRTAACTGTGLQACYNFNNTTKDITGRGNHGILMFQERYVAETRIGTHVPPLMYLLLQ